MRITERNMWWIVSTMCCVTILAVLSQSKDNALESRIEVLEEQSVLLAQGGLETTGAIRKFHPDQMFIDVDDTLSFPGQPGDIVFDIDPNNDASILIDVRETSYTLEKEEK